MISYQERVVKERNQLELKLNGLCAFLHTETFSSLEEEDKRLLENQRCAMADYLQALEQRIARFPKEEAS